MAIDGVPVLALDHTGRVADPAHVAVLEQRGAGEVLGEQRRRGQNIQAECGQPAERRERTVRHCDSAQSSAGQTGGATGGVSIWYLIDDK
ncbi:hypothetical protein [uncultured Xanthomonas sp.]|uniref:hypothetical protein n=1 Tax=uncultured Xanthomonas sp. TaxID=152831 RepID=UPI0025E3D9F6|nr:hypothetical protein [uncultured Xanthomonas sp.]